MSADRRQHTPGPWRLTVDDTGVRRIEGTEPLKGALMCDERYYPWCPEEIEDWRLISAAPDLLAAAKCALNDRMYKDWPDIADLLIAAIAKAEGCGPKGYNPTSP